MRVDELVGVDYVLQINLSAAEAHELARDLRGRLGQVEHVKEELQRQLSVLGYDDEYEGGN